ncbi:unnamed protein product [Orchesella dallaii]|uniref:Peptidase S8/S53 domain-containing protein n=1 Tax=Orchesella dallaii TaxID=48710 RepID=A0ABP1S055_9HEXA
MSQLLISFICLFFSTLVQAQTIQDQSLLSDSFSNVMITLNPSVRPIIQQIGQQEFESNQAKRFALVENMRAWTQAVQGPLLFLLQDLKVANMTIKSFWITNGIIVRNLPLPLLELVLLLSVPFNIASIERVQEFPVLPTFDSGPVLTAAPQVAPAMPWGIKDVNAPQVWDQGIRGQGCTVGIIDTGVRETHEAIAGRVLLDQCLDPMTGLSSVPDLNGHGTHVTGTICGGMGIGVAPEAEVVMCKGCGTSFCTQDSLLTCGEHMICPTSDCEDGPDIVSNSWGGGSNSDSYDDMLFSWEIVGMLPVFAIGNSGPACSTANTPGDRPIAFGVGAVMINKNLTSFSSKGPTNAGNIKPEISAPGANVLSADFKTNDGYQSLSGTSMACPHVAGVAALLISAFPGITTDNLRNVLVQSTNKSVVTSGFGCGGKVNSNFPNNYYGHGFVDALKALNLASQLLTK